MIKQNNEKNLKWATSDVAKCVTVFLVNTIIIFAMYVIAVMLNGKAISELVGVLIDTSTLHFLLLLVMSVGILALYFAFEDRNFLKNSANIEMIFIIIEISLIICFALGKYVNVYLRPLALPAILALYLTNRKSSVIVEIVFCIIFLLIDSFSFKGVMGVEDSVLVFGFASGIVAIFGMGQNYSRFKLIAKSFLISIPTLAAVGLIILKNGSDGIIEKLICAFCSGPLAVASFIVLLPIFEAVFKKVSCFKYAELTDHKSRLIRRLITEAPGTFNHSIVVSNIAEACATAIGEDAMLARTCAYYHDIGKLRRPEFFTENQTDGVNPHDDLTPELSTNIIKAHAKDGYSLAKKHRLPKEIADACVEHHGTLPILYFYDKAKKFTDGEVDINQFCYAGPKPQSKISAIIMIADGSEAAARSLKDRSRASVYGVVRKIVDDRLKLGQFDECEITIKELNIVINTIVNNLTGIYHNRVEYPKVKINETR